MVNSVTPWSRLLRALARGRLGHGLLFLGPLGSGREATALDVARARLCDAGDGTRAGCGACAACRRVDGGTHPDVHLVLTEAEAVERGVREPEGSRRPSREHRIDAIRELARQLRLRPFEGRAQVAIVHDAHRMTENAANALLKTLEEPSEDAVLILIAPHLRAVLPTIASRCQRLAFAPFSDDALRRALTERGASDVEERVARAHGSLSRALALDVDEERDRTTRARDLLRAAGSLSVGTRLDAVDAAGKDRGEALNLLATLEVTLVQALRDDIVDDLGLSADEALRLLVRVQDTRDAIEQNAHVQLALEDLLVDVRATA